jgi:hypothetical protein
MLKIELHRELDHIALEPGIKAFAPRRYFPHAPKSSKNEARQIDVMAIFAILDNLNLPIRLLTHFYLTRSLYSSANSVTLPLNTQYGPVSAGKELGDKKAIRPSIEIP